MKKGLLIGLLCLCYHLVQAQPFLIPSDSFNKKRAIGVTATGALLWGGSIASLQFVWYNDFEKSKFHFFDDSHEWGQMDKMGHLYVSNQVAGVVTVLYKWSGVSSKNAALIGAAYSFGYMTTFEILDAYNTEWGFSLSDVGFNALGTASYCAQSLLWDQQYLHFKFSFHNSGLAAYRPQVLGNDFSSRTLKDYNGQTYWMSFNPFNWTKKESKIPKWINISLGYGIDNQLIGDGGTYVVADGSSQLTFTPYRQYYLSADIDFEQIPTKSRLLKLFFRTINVIKIPFPTLEYSQGAFQFHPFYF
jgi:hypothetical protein